MAAERSDTNTWSRANSAVGGEEEKSCRSQLNEKRREGLLTLQNLSRKDIALRNGSAKTKPKIKTVQRRRTFDERERGSGSEGKSKKMAPRAPRDCEFVCAVASAASAQRGAESSGTRPSRVTLPPRPPAPCPESELLKPRHGHRCPRDQCHHQQRSQV